MKTDRRESIQRGLRNLVETFVTQLGLLENTYTLLSQELALDPLNPFEPFSKSLQFGRSRRFVVDQSSLSVKYRGRSCFLGNTLTFRFIARLAERPNAYVSHDELLVDVWEGNRSDAAIRSVVKMLRRKLRSAGLVELANAIDGSASGHYSLKLLN
jgi:DNA-binding response OmpR family regulator